MPKRSYQDPNIDKNQSLYYGIPNPANADRIREQSCKMARTREEVDTEITERTAGAADENIQVETYEVRSD
ncbi:MAG: hypothetical protein KAI94_14240 [Anaerolineales bacterium]|nr:hypothetical protein [Anaerolineales bacterium]